LTEVRDRLRATLSDRYTVDREIGRGGMATVYLAEDIKHGRQVALKVLHPELAATLGSDRFLREIQIAARLQHSHIVPLYDSGQADSLLYYVMPFVEGQSLRDRLSMDTALSVEEAVSIARDIAAAIDYAHRQGVVHRDIKPENVMLHEGEAIVTDFGIAKAVSAAGGESLTQVGMAVGTPAYMSPEQASGEMEPDGRSDIYSLGCVLYEMLTGSAPFAGSTVQALILKRFTDPVPSARATHAHITLELDAVVTRALAKEPRDRFATGAQVAQALGSPKVVTPHATPLATPKVAPQKSIAVLPFADMSPQKDQDYFCEGIADEIISALTKIHALRVISRSSAFAFKGQNQDIRKVGAQLNVGTVLEGSIRKSGNRLRITAQLISVAGGHHLWSERYDRDLEDVFAIQDEIAENIVKALRVVLTEDEKGALEKSSTESVEAYDYYLRGRQYFQQWRRKGVEYARRMFERAIEIDPTFARAYAGIADCCSFMYTYWDASATNLERAISASLQALKLDPELAEAHVSRGVALAYAKQYAESEIEFRQAIRLSRNLFEAHYSFAGTLLQQGRNEEAAAEFQQASRIRPEDYQAPCFHSQALKALGRDAESAAMAQGAIALLVRHLDLNPDDPRALSLGGSLMAQSEDPGQRAQAMGIANRALASDPEDSAMLYNIACLYAKLGETEQALACLEKSVRFGFGLKEWLVHDPDLSALRNEPRFEKLLAAL